MNQASGGSSPPVTPCPASVRTHDDLLNREARFESSAGRLGRASRWATASGWKPDDRKTLGFDSPSFRLPTRNSMNALQKPVLVLNRNWQPVHVATVARAWCCCGRTRRGWSMRATTRRSRGRIGRSCAQPARTPSSIGQLPAAPAGGHHADRLRQAADEGRDVQPSQHFQARPVSVPVLRRQSQQREDLTIDHVVPRCAGRRLELDELRLSLRRLQQEEGGSHAAAGEHEDSQGAGLPDVEAGICEPSRRLESWSKFISEAYWNVELQK